jgi:hypothetical protein
MTGPAGGGASAAVVLPDDAERERTLRQIAQIEGKRRQAWLVGDAEGEAFLEREARDLRARLGEGA